MNNNNFKFEELKSCPYCDSEKIAIILEGPDRLSKIPGEFFLSKCLDCKLVFQNPRIKENNVDIFYTDSLGYYNPPKIKNQKTFIEKQIIKALICYLNYNHLGNCTFINKITSWPFLKFIRVQSIPKFKQEGKLLEIGCSYGNKLKRLQNFGWTVKGIEINKKMAEYGNKKLDLEISNKKIENADFKEGEFDVIIMNMVLEHLYNPFETLKFITKWLKKDGQLIFSIPYFNGIEFKLFKNYCYGLQLPTHITFLNKKIILDFLNKIGYNNIKFFHHFFERDFIASAQYKYDENKKLFYKVLASKNMKIFVIKPLMYILSFFKLTSRISIYAHKK